MVAASCSYMSSFVRVVPLEFLKLFSEAIMESFAWTVDMTTSRPAADVGHAKIPEKQ